MLKPKKEATRGYITVKSSRTRIILHYSNIIGPDGVRGLHNAIHAYISTCSGKEFFLISPVSSIFSLFPSHPSGTRDYGYHPSYRAPSR